MRCRACDCALNDREATRKYASDGTFVDLCDRDFKYISDEIQVVDNPKHVKDQPAEPTLDNPEDIDI